MRTPMAVTADMKNGPSYGSGLRIVSTDMDRVSSSKVSKQ